MALIDKHNLHRASVFEPISKSDLNEFCFLGYATTLESLSYIKEPKENALVYCVETKSEYIYFNNQWIKINGD